MAGGRHPGAAEPSLRAARRLQNAIAAGVALLGCSEPTHAPRPQPALVAPRPAGQLAPLVVDGLGFSPGERFIWAVRVRGFAVGNAELSVSEGEIRSHFATSSVAHLFANVSHDLTTTLDGAGARAAQERLDIDGTVRQFSMTFGEASTHSLHTALGVLRGWARAGAAPGYLQIFVGGETVRVELGEPATGKDWTKVAGTLVGLERPATFTCWLDGAHVITRVEVRSGLETITADLLR